MQWKQKNFGHENVEQMLVVAFAIHSFYSVWANCVHNAENFMYDAYHYHITVNYCQ
jgi:hypothetical protein